MKPTVTLGELPNETKATSGASVGGKQEGGTTRGENEEGKLHGTRGKVSMTELLVIATPLQYNTSRERVRPEAHHSTKITTKP